MSREETRSLGQKLREWALNGALAAALGLGIVLLGSTILRAVLPPRPHAHLAGERETAAASLAPGIEPGSAKSAPAAAGEREIRVQVLNGCGVPGAGSGMASVLRLAGGVDVVEIGNADQFDYESSLVLDRTGNPALAQRVAQVLDGAPVIRQRLASSPGEVTVIVGYDHGRWLTPLPGGGGR